MIIDMRLFGVMGFLLLPRIVMTMCQRTMVVFVGMPRGPMLPFITRLARVVMGDMIVVVGVSHNRMGMLRLLARPFGILPDHETPSARVYPC
jgi:hypothetical protein